jgi:hypothetical protein
VNTPPPLLPTDLIRPIRGTFAHILPSAVLDDYPKICLTPASGVFLLDLQAFNYAPSLETNNSKIIGRGNTIRECKRIDLAAQSHDSYLCAALITIINRIYSQFARPSVRPPADIRAKTIPCGVECCWWVVSVLPLASVGRISVGYHEVNQVQ